MPLLQNTDAVELESAIPLDLYLQRVYRPDCDYIDGEVRERNAGYYPHSAMMVIVGAMLHECAKTTDTVALLSVRIRVSDDCVLVPDICLARRTRPREDVIVTPPLLCVEVVAEADTFLAMQERVDRLLSMGVENVWLIDERGRFGWVASRQGFLRLKDGVFRIDGTPITISLAGIAGELDEN
jgi:Uma2 family endonuclease